MWGSSSNAWRKTQAGVPYSDVPFGTEGMTGYARRGGIQFKLMDAPSDYRTGGRMLP